MDLKKSLLRYFPRGYIFMKWFPMKKINKTKAGLYTKLKKWLEKLGKIIAKEMAKVAKITLYNISIVNGETLNL